MVIPNYKEKMTQYGIKVTLYAVYFMYAHSLLLEISSRTSTMYQGQNFTHLRIFVGENFVKLSQIIKVIFRGEMSQYHTKINY